MKELLGQAVEELRALVAIDTRNPPRKIGLAGTADGELVSYLTSRLTAAGMRVSVRDEGQGCVSVLAERGSPRVLFNVHLDTVPSGSTWTADPLVLRTIDDDVATDRIAYPGMVFSRRYAGLGTCDIKGAAACLIALAATTPHDLALLFTTDEEAGPGLCVKAFLDGWVDGPRAYELVVVGEPTRLQAVVAHRGIGSALGVFPGVAGHGSHARALADSAVHGGVRWASRALAFAEAEESIAMGGLTGVRFNLGVLSGGAKSNVIADRCEARFGVRPRPGESPADLVARITALAPPDVQWTTTFSGPSLARSPIAVEKARALGIAESPAVDYWTEAALFAERGLPVFVFGPGDIAQAHAADEWVSAADLEAALAVYARIVSAP